MIRRFLFIFALMTVATLVFSACTLFPDKNDGNQTPGTDDGNQTPPECIHSFSSWGVAQQATCKDEGIMSRTCSKCGEVETSKIGMSTTHTEVIDEAVAPTCTEAGLTEGKHCSVCGWVFVAQSETPATGHKYTNDYDATCNDCGATRQVECGHFEVKPLPAREVSCTENGLTEGEICALCELILVEQTVIEATGHNTVTDAAVAPTCTESGLTEGSHCTKCGEVFVPQGHIKALGHNEGNWIIDKEPTETEDGYKYKKCNRCGEKTTEEIITFIGDLGIDYEVNSDGKTCTVTGIGNFEGTELVIPDYIKNYKVTDIGEKAFADCAKLTKLVIPETTVTIGTRAFYGCIGLTEFTIPASVKSIGNQIFYKATNLTKVTYNSSYSSSMNVILNTTSITTVVFGGTGVPGHILDGCTNVTEVVINEGVTSIGYYAFSGCSSLASIAIPDGITSIGGQAFYNCSSLTEIVIPKGITNIDNHTFSGCSSLTSIVIPDSVTSIDGGAFYNCSSLTEIIIPDSIISIGNYAFYGCSSLTSIVIPEGVTSIGDHAFYGCSSLTKILIPDSVTSIYARTFEGCKSLASIVIPESVTSIGGWAFDDCKSLADVYYSGSEDAWGQISIGDGNYWLNNATKHFNYTPANE